MYPNISNLDSNKYSSKINKQSRQPKLNSKKTKLVPPYKVDNDLKCPQLSVSQYDYKTALSSRNKAVVYNRKQA